ncbi:MAG: hypothetical protein R3B90_13975 [Planctomycetaceae bacterium]
MSSPATSYKRIVLKLSGESFSRNRESAIAMSEVDKLSKEIKSVYDTGVELAIVCGGGNILRGKEFAEFSQTINPPTALHGHAGDGHQWSRPARRGSRTSACRRASCPRFAWRASRSRSSGSAAFDTSKRNAW